MIEITDQEAQSWPLDEAIYICSCGTVTRTTCGYCGEILCDELSCIKNHAAKGCYTRYRNALDAQANGNPDPPPNARPEHDPQGAVPKPAMDEQATQ